MFDGHWGVGILSFRGWDAQSEAQRVTVHAMQVVMIAGTGVHVGSCGRLRRPHRTSLLNVERVLPTHSDLRFEHC